MPRTRVTRSDYQRLLAMRTSLRRFLHWSGEQAEAAGLTPAQHQLLLAVHGHAGRRPPAIGDLSDVLLLKHHSTVSLLDRAERAGLLVRERDDIDRRVVRIRLTDEGIAKLEALSRVHIEELRRMAGAFAELAAGLSGDSIEGT